MPYLALMEHGVLRCELFFAVCRPPHRRSQVDKRTSMFLAVFVRILHFLATVFRRNFRPCVSCNVSLALHTRRQSHGGVRRAARLDANARDSVEHDRRTVFVSRARLRRRATEAERAPPLRRQEMEAQSLARADVRQVNAARDAHRRANHVTLDLAASAASQMNQIKAIPFGFSRENRYISRRCKPL